MDDVNRSVSGLMMGTLGAPGVDNFGRESNQRRSLLLDVVMQGRPRESGCRLLQLPAEILADIVDLLSNDKTSPASLALVNSDCQQLARCCQFAEVHFGYSPQAQQLASQLAVDKSTQLPKPSIGACIRRVTFASRGDYVAHSHRELYESIWGDDARSVTSEHRKSLHKEAGEKYVVVRTAVLLAISALPNLETLSWKDGYSLDKNFFETITRCTARNIELNRPSIDDAWFLKPPLTPSTWPVTSLKLYNVEMALDKWREIEKKGRTTTHHLTSFFSTLFHLCSPTLESLSWSYFDLIRADGVPVSIGETAMSFPRLKYLQLEYFKLDSVAISSFLAALLKSLDLSDEILDNVLTLDCEPFRDLESFAVAHLPRGASACKRIANFITQHTKIHRLYIHESESAQEHISIQ